MISVQEASQIIARYMPNWGESTTGLSDQYFPQTLEPSVADRDYPPYERVMMDGIAISFSAYQKGRREFEIEGIAPAGVAAQKLKTPEGCLEVMTGAPLPMGADLVIQYEHLKIDNGKALVVTDIPRTIFESVHRAGSDCKKGSIVLEQGHELNGPHWGIAASMGQTMIKTKRMPKIMIISTGDELVEVNSLPADHQIRRSNVYALKASLNLNGYHQVTLSHLNDDPKIISAHYEKHASEFDMLIYSGGVSKGKFDYLPHVWSDLGVKKHFHEVQQRPGKPLWFGVDEKLKTAVIGLPGNPVSSLVCLHRYFIPTREMSAKLTQDVKFKKNLTYFLPVRVTFVEGVMLANPMESQNSGEFIALAGSDGFVELPADQDEFLKGQSFSFFPWRGF